MTVDDRAQRDRELFNEIADSYSKKDAHGACRPARRHRLERTLAAVPLGTDIRLLEVGCGAGHAADYLAGRYREYCGIDHAEALVEGARQSFGSDAVTFEHASAEDFSGERPFDAVLMIGVLHHLEDPVGTLRHVVRQLAPGGWFLANEPHPTNPLISVARWVRKRVDAKYSPDQVELSARQLDDVLRESGLVDRRLVPQGVLSTPFAEVPLGPTALTRPLARASCAVDSLLEGTLGRALRPLTWNLIAAGRKP